MIVFCALSFGCLRIFHAGSPLYNRYCATVNYLQFGINFTTNNKCCEVMIQASIPMRESTYKNKKNSNIYREKKSF